MQCSGLKVLGYTRVSTDDQAQNGSSLVDQAARIRALSANLGLDLAGIVEDAGECSKTLDRPGLWSVLERLESGEVLGLVVAKLDRLTRHVGDMCHLVEKYFLPEGGRRLFSASEQADTRSAKGRMVIYIMAAVDQGIREQIVENTAGAMAGKRSRSERMGNIPFGKRLAEDGKTLVDCEEDNGVLAEIVRLSVHGLSLREIADELNARGIPSKRGVTKRSTGRWSKSTISDILKGREISP